MKVITITENGKKFMFVCESRGTRSGFAHDCTLFIDNCEYTKASCYYLNRTWEYWQYQSVCLHALDNVETEKIDILKTCFLTDHGYKRMTPARRKEFEKLVSESPYIMTLKKVRENLHKVH